MWMWIHDLLLPTLYEDDLTDCSDVVLLIIIAAANLPFLLLNHMMMMTNHPSIKGSEFPEYICG